MPSRAKSLMIIDPGVRVAEVDSLNHIAMQTSVKVTYHLPVLGGMESLDYQSPLGIIILGSSSSVYDSSEWQESFKKWLEPKLLAGVPTLGLCYGHQLIAHMFGADVAFVYPDKTKLEGLRTVNLQKEIGIPSQGKLVVTHREQVTSIPRGFDLLATSADVKIDGLCHKTLPIWTFQPHPEATLDFLKNQKIPVVGADDLIYGHSLINQFLKNIERGTFDE